jgi:hypothetical protein
MSASQLLESLGENADPELIERLMRESEDE